MLFSLQKVQTQGCEQDSQIPCSDVGLDRLCSVLEAADFGGQKMVAQNSANKGIWYSEVVGSDCIIGQSEWGTFAQ